MAEQFLYEVRRGKKVLMQTSDPKSRYAPEVERFLLRSGCDIYINGKKQTQPSRGKVKAAPVADRGR